jgi:hypothetical protein
MREPLLLVLDRVNVARVRSKNAILHVYKELLNLKLEHAGNKI